MTQAQRIARLELRNEELGKEVAELRRTCTEQTRAMLMLTKQRDRKRVALSILLRRASEALALLDALVEP